MSKWARVYECLDRARNAALLRDRRVPLREANVEAASHLRATVRRETNFACTVINMIKDILDTGCSRDEIYMVMQFVKREARLSSISHKRRMTSRPLTRDEIIAAIRQALGG